ncbi:solute carrier family 2, facilitated glucose transporter member 3 isoform X2 [Drosophila ficusphila]|uniref:solute carrier family 2, facilitated glucose transporter member 3 isoform X2 n=1 Tax=Drosophila ficusphila TaxID=30025 RepID=UPI0007E7CBA6|nr:solute carrier family 2, facilitated glucose transporter member 3 isoform X2 [Drosophila ficusphila]
MAEGNQGWTAFLMLICVSITVGTVIPIGYAFGVVNAPSAFIRSWIMESASTRYSSQLGDSQVTIMMSSVVSVFLVGGMLGAPFAPIFSARLGRRGVLTLSGLLLLVSCICQSSCRLANSIEMLLLGRLIAGLAAALILATQPMYLVELAPAELSGSVGVFTAIGITGGVVLGQVFTFDFLLGTEELWPYALAASGIFVVIGLAPVFWFPESPRFLMSQGRKEKARVALMRLRKDEGRVDAELAEFEAATREAGQKITVKEVFCNSKLKMPLIIVSSFNFVLQMSGISAIFFYSVDIFTESGFSAKEAMWLNFALGLQNFFNSLLAPVLMRRFSRRLMMMLSCLLCALFLTTLVVSLKLMVSINVFSYVGIASLLLYIVGFNLGLGCIPYFIEIFESRPRPSAMAFGSFFNWLANFLLGMVFPILNSTVGPFVFLICTSFCIYGFLLTCRYLPETRNRDPKEVAPLMENGFKSKIK